MFESEAKDEIYTTTTTYFELIKRFCDAVGYPQATPKLYTTLVAKYPKCSGNVKKQIWLDYYENVVIPHKVAVFAAGQKLYLPITNAEKVEWITRLLTHDLSKFSELETIEYAEYNFKGENTDKAQFKFELAFMHHKKVNDHHPEYWLNPNKSGVCQPLAMPHHSVLEMVADWMGASETYGTPLLEWLQGTETKPANLPKFLFHSVTGLLVQQILEELLDLEVHYKKVRVSDNGVELRTLYIK